MRAGTYVMRDRNGNHGGQRFPGSNRNHGGQRFPGSNRNHGGQRRGAALGRGLRHAPEPAADRNHPNSGFFCDGHH
jgi:hypothetical protein